MKAESSLRCSFCNKGEGEVRKLISSPSRSPRVYICDECIAVCQFILADDQPDGESGVQSLPQQSGADGE